MTETEYVERIKASAQSYIAAFEASEGDIMTVDQGRSAVAKWEHTKTYLSPSTAIEMCDAWLSARGEDRTGQHEQTQIRT